MNRQLHAEFEALSALPVDELTQEEWALLQIHLAYCTSCTEKFEQYQHIVSQLLPRMAAGASADTTPVAVESAAAFAAAEYRLMNSVAEASSTPTAQAVRVIPWKIVSGVLAACILGLAALVGGDFIAKTKQTMVSIAPTKRTAPTSSHGTDEPLQLALADAQKRVDALQQEAKASERQSYQAALATKTAEQQLAAESAQRNQIASERDGLKQQLENSQAEAQSWRDKATAATSTMSQQTSQREELENKVHLLNVALTEKEAALDANERMLALDKDFLDHDRDIRDLIGARNLYISDIFDTAENGKTSKPFGRIFYTKDRSLVFYGFDLDKQAGITEAASFQVWGSGSDKQPVSLGMFYQDDSHKRWVLRCNDEKALARLNMVFVTVEPPGGSRKPTGKQMLRAYLQIQPNHP